MKSFFMLLWAALKNPLQVSTVFETGDSAAETLIADVPSMPSGMIVELGVGTGAITKSLAAKLRRPESYVGLELNEDLIEFSKERFPKLRFVEDSAENFPTYLNGQRASAVISSLPWTLLPDGKMEEILQAVVKNLEPDGVFSTYMTLHVLKTPAGKRFQELMQTLFLSVETKLVIDNLPPAKIFIARK